jgi:hypothetical protein
MTLPTVPSFQAEGQFTAMTGLVSVSP